MKQSNQNSGVVERYSKMFKADVSRQLVKFKFL